MEVIVAYLTHKPVNFLEGLRKATADLSIPANIPTKRPVNKIWTRCRKKQITNKRT
jgi:hypothetical protein